MASSSMFSASLLPSSLSTSSWLSWAADNSPESFHHENDESRAHSIFNYSITTPPSPLAEVTLSVEEEEYNNNNYGQISALDNNHHF